MRKIVFYLVLYIVVFSLVWGVIGIIDPNFEWGCMDFIQKICLLAETGGAAFIIYKLIEEVRKDGDS